ncbi:hypothetical protein [Sphaerisporangium siamense]|uniref:Uncharacterized protein n=1 Tax=Sphaerisporangium siamense TaxID=795645 RepID=A0A7W7D432_9ACTN|nr:hypothetical protein [Sphaerisporangium siamense]MBB4699721.1 hypothetical protein [Sphaerisporangium siamense]
MSARIRWTAPVLAAALCTPAHAAYAGQASPSPDMPVAQAFDGDKPLSSVAKVTERCAERPGDCRFTIDKSASGEYYSAVKSLGNAVINCTLHSIKVTRQVTLRTSTSDNLGGHIAGKISAEGSVNGSGEITGGVNAEGNGSFDTPNKQQGPSATVGAKAGANGSGKISGSLGVKGAFEGAFQLQYQRTWTTENTESTSYDVTVPSGDALVFGASSAMQRIAGTITVGGLQIREVVVDGPSSINTSTFFASTMTAPGGTCQRLRPEDKPPTGGPGDRLAAGGLTELTAPPPGARLKERVTLPVGRP